MVRFKKKISDSSISCEAELKNKKITLAEYNAIIDILAELWHDENSKVETIMSAVSDFFKREEYVVKEKSVGWVISVM